MLENDKFTEITLELQYLQTSQQINRKKNISPQVISFLSLTVCWNFFHAVYSIMTFSFVLFTYHLLHLFLYRSISFSHSLFVSFSLSSSFTFPKALSFFSLRLSVSVSVSYTLLFLPSSCSSPEAFLFFSFFVSFYGCDRKSSCHTADWFRSSHPDRVFSELWPHDCKSAPLLTVWPPLKSLGSLKGNKWHFTRGLLL